MLLLPRIAVGTIQPQADRRTILWALMEAFREKGLQVQSLCSRAYFQRHRSTVAVTGLSPRHLDSWLMSSARCRELAFRAAEDADLLLVEGEFDDAMPANSPAGGSLDTLCRWLDLPSLVVLDARQLTAGCLPEKPPHVDALLLDRFGDGRRLSELTAALEAAWGVPVLGALPELLQLRARFDAAVWETSVGRDLCRCLAQHFMRHSNVDRLLELALQHELSPTVPQLFRSGSYLGPLLVALAYDDALHCYFPDMLDALESRGATIVDFSPLRDERLPDGADVVYLGCGHPEEFAAELSGNHCMKLALRNHLRLGGRIYAEGGGLAYLCQQIEQADGALSRMVGIFPAIARHQPPGKAPLPAEVTLNCPTWLCRSGSRLRGYTCPLWKLRPVGPLVSCLAQAKSSPQFAAEFSGESSAVVVRSWRAIGSLLHLNFSAETHLLDNFFRNPLSQPKQADPWAVAG